jgi:lipid II:glycine glycyltransferase (peptidoglycan interpeptide bridge formation enzyme)
LWFNKPLDYFMEYLTTDFQNPALNKIWDNFITNHSQGSVHQISDWAKFQATIPGRTHIQGHYITEKNSEKILVAAITVQMDTGFFGKKWAYSARGPVGTENTEAVKLLIQKTAETLKKSQIIFWRTDPYITPEEGKKLWKNFAENTTLKTTNTTQNYQPTDTLELDLSLSEEALLAQMKRQARSVIKKLEKNPDITFQHIAAENITKKHVDDFYVLNAETTERDRFSGHQKIYYQSFLKNLPKNAALFFIKYKNTPIATAINTHAAGKAIYYFGASSSEEAFRPLRAPYLLQWEMIKIAKNNWHCATYDFLGIAPEDQPHHHYKGITQFKTRFGGYRKIYHVGQEITLNTFWYFLYRLAKKIR